MYKEGIDFYPFSPARLAIGVGELADRLVPSAGGRVCVNCGARIGRSLPRAAGLAPRERLRVPPVEEAARPSDVLFGEGEASGERGHGGDLTALRQRQSRSADGGDGIVLTREWGSVYASHMSESRRARITIELEGDLVDRIEAYRRRTPVPPQRLSVMRYLLELGLRQVEAQK
jgi:hypothetical protein